MKTKGLTIQEAIQSGLPFKRSGWIEYYEPHCNYDYSPKSILANDWQIKVPEVTITREKLAEAWESYEQTSSVSIGANYSPLFQHICKELGL